MVLFINVWMELSFMGNKENLKAYILVKDSVDLGHAINSVCHAGCLIPQHFPQYKCGIAGEIDGIDPVMEKWYSDYFRKVTCKVTAKEFEKAKEYDDWFVVTELALNNDEVVLVFKPRYEWPKFFNFLKLYK
jgi:hypothetical protein